MRVSIKGTGWQFPAAYYPTGKVEPEKADDSIVSMVYQAVRKCLEDAGETMSAVDAVVTASIDLLDGKTASNISITEVVGR
jgi:3-oxoacyl-[acyl-carrier-protein] synthase III